MSVRRMRIYGLSFSLLLMLVTSAGAETLDRLYEVTVPVLDQSDKERRLALMNALDQVLARASGQPLTVLQDNAIVQTQRQKPEDYLLEYSYEARKESLPAENSPRASSSTRKSAPAAVTSAPAAQLTARFSPQAIRTLLGKAALPLWPRQRPTVLVWWQLEENGQHHLADMTFLQAEAEQRGIPVVLPMGDLQDKLALEGLWQLEADTIARVAERYGVPAVLVGRATAFGAAGWRGQWLLYFQGQLIAIPSGQEEGFPASILETETLRDLEMAAVTAVVQVMLQHYGIQLGALPTPVELSISGVASFESYGEILRYLQGLESIKTMSLLDVDRQTLHYLLVCDGSLLALQELLELGGLLMAEQDGAAMEDTLTASTPVLRYRFSRR